MSDLKNQLTLEDAIKKLGNRATALIADLSREASALSKQLEEEHAARAELAEPMSGLLKDAAWIGVKEIDLNTPYEDPNGLRTTAMIQANGYTVGVLETQLQGGKYRLLVVMLPMK